MERRSVGGLVYYAFQSLARQPGLVHGISSRHGGVSPAPFDTLNMGLASGDARANVEANWATWHQALGLDVRSKVIASQASGDGTAVVGAGQAGSCIRDVDALLTQAAGIPLTLRMADCVPVLLFDPVQRAVGVVHAGWRGTVLKITQKAVGAMAQAFGTRPADLLACVGPSIGPCCYHVGDDVVSRVRHALRSADALLAPAREGGAYLDLWKANEEQLRQAGVEQIETAGLCTAHHADEFYSARAGQGRTGRFAATIALVE